MTPANSYAGREIPFPGSSHSSSPSPTASRHVDSGPVPRPRPLFTEKRLPQLSHDDPIAYSLFIEAISLLAWNVAWLCRTQGYVTGTENWEDICSIGRNLWQLFGPSPPITGGLSRARSSRDATLRQRQNTSRGTGGTPPPLRRALSAPRLGHYSHGTSHTFLCGPITNPNNYTFFQDWKSRRYTTVSDPLKRTLLSEMSNAEWELLDEPAWADGTGDFGGDDETVFVKTKSDPSTGNRQAMSRTPTAAAPNAQKTNPTSATPAGGMIAIQSKIASASSPPGASSNDADPANPAGGGNTVATTIPEVDTTTGPITGSPSGRTTTRGTSGWTKLRSRENA